MQKSQISSPLWSVESQVVKGRQLGRTIDFPTANLDAQLLQNLPNPVVPGVYATLINWLDQELVGATYYGPRFDRTKVDNNLLVDNLLEVYILDFDQEIYGETLSVSAYKLLRPPLKFDSLEALKTQIANDVEQIRAWYTDRRLLCRHSGLDQESQDIVDY